MKKIFLLILVIFSFFWNNIINAADCTYDGNWDVTSSFQKCLPSWALEATENKKTWNWFWWSLLSVSSNNWWDAWYTVNVAKNKVVYASQKLVIVAWILAVWWVAYSWMMFVLWLWDAEKIKKAKWALKWSLLWFLIAIISQQLINATINLIFSLSN